MPTYEYKCPVCFWTKDLLLNFNDNRNVFCPRCMIKTNRSFGGGTAIHFKGSGFYETDYKGK